MTCVSRTMSLVRRYHLRRHSVRIYVPLHAHQMGMSHEDLCFTNNVIVDIQCRHYHLRRHAAGIYGPLHAHQRGIVHDDLCFTNNVILDIWCVAFTCDVTQWGGYFRATPRSSERNSCVSRTLSLSTFGVSLSPATSLRGNLRATPRSSKRHGP